MPIQVTCPHCSKTISAPDKFAGRNATCPACKNPIEIPSPDDEIEVPDFSQPQTVAVGPAKVEVAPAAPPTSPYAPSGVASTGDHRELQRVKIVGIRLPFMDVLVLVVQAWIIGFVLTVVLWIVMLMFVAAMGLSFRAP